jgi:hypothetical protein
MKRIFLWAAGVIVIISLVAALLSYRPTPEKIQYGATFTKLHSDELKLDTARRSTTLACANCVSPRIGP